MSKYIDAEKLIADIERWRDKANEKYNESTYSMGRCDALAEFRNHIASLQQDQPEVDLVAELEHHLATTPKEQLEKEWKELEPWNNVGPTVQEFLYGKQLEANLEKIIGQTYHDGSVADTSDMDLVDYENIARHFYELGLNARKEE